VSFTVRTEDRVWSHRGTRAVPAASTLKAMLLVAYLRRPGVRRRALTRADRALLAPMVRRSDNVTATRVRDLLGDAQLRRFARRAGMRRFRTHPVWGLSRVDAADLSRFMLGADRLTPRRHRAYAMRLLRTIVDGQRWGIARVAPPGWTLHFKGGWGSGSGAVDHQVVQLRRRDGTHIGIAVMTTGSPSHRYAKRTLRGVFARLLGSLP
jgi:hypothetical protein